MSHRSESCPVYVFSRIVCFFTQFVLQCVAVSRRCSVLSVLQYVAVCCSVLQCVAIRCSVLQCVAMSTFSNIADDAQTATRYARTPTIVYCIVLQCVTMSKSMSQCVEACCSVLPHCVAEIHTLPPCTHTQSAHKGHPPPPPFSMYSKTITQARQMSSHVTGHVTSHVTTDRPPLLTTSGAARGIRRRLKCGRAWFPRASPRAVPVYVLCIYMCYMYE